MPISCPVQSQWSIFTTFLLKEVSFNFSPAFLNNYKLFRCSDSLLPEIKVSSMCTILRSGVEPLRTLFIGLWKVYGTFVYPNGIVWNSYNPVRPEICLVGLEVVAYSGCCRFRPPFAGNISPFESTEVTESITNVFSRPTSWLQLLPNVMHSVRDIDHTNIRMSITSCPMINSC